MPREVLHLDFETYSDLDLRKVGAYRYAEHPSTEVLVACWKLGTGPIVQWEPHLCRAVPSSLSAALSDRSVYVMAHNAEFERCILTEVMGVNLPRERYRCTAARAAAAGLPRSLDGALKTLGSPIRKDTKGASALRKFSRPRKPTKHDDRVRVYPADDPVAWATLLAYNKQDVVAEMEVDRQVPDLSGKEWKFYHYIMKVNDRGLPLDRETLAGAAKVVAALEIEAVQRVVKLTGGIAPTQVEKLRNWLADNGAELPNLQLKTIETALRGELPRTAREVLNIRVEASKASTKKIKSMQNVVCDDGRARGCILYYGAGATGRLSGKLIQPHNFTRGLLGDSAVEQGRIQGQVLDLFAAGDVDVVRMICWHQPADKPSGKSAMQGPMSMLAQSMRGFIRAPKGYTFYVADYAAIEARLLAYMANEVKLLIAYRNKIDTYKMMASDLYKIPIEEVNKEQRRIGKNLRLGAGYQLGAPTLVEHCAKEEIIIDLEFARKAIAAFRNTNKNIVRSWGLMEAAAVQAVVSGGEIQGLPDRDVYFEKWRDWLLMVLPSGRKLHYYAPKVQTVVRFHKPKQQLSYFGERKGSIAGRVTTYGGKLIENLMQAMARDIMMEGMLSGEEAGYPALASIHDEDLTIRRIGEGSEEELEIAVCRMPRWAKDIPLQAEGFVVERYQKG